MAPSGSPHGFISSKPRDTHPNRRPSRPFSHCWAYMGHIHVQVCENKLGKEGGISDGNVPASLIIKTNCPRFFSPLATWPLSVLAEAVSFPWGFGRGHMNDFNQWNVRRHHPLGQLPLMFSRALAHPLVVGSPYSILRAVFAWSLSMWWLPGAYLCFH